MPSTDSTEQSRLERLLGRAWDVLPVAAVIVDQGGTVRYCSDQTSYLLGYEPDQVVGSQVEGLMAKTEEISSERSDDDEEGGARVVDGDLEFYARHRNGGIVPVRLSLTQVEDTENNEVWTLVLMQDRRPLADPDDSGSEAEERYRQLFEQEQVGLIWARLDGEVLSCNPAAADMFGYGSPEEFEGRSFIEHYRGDSEERQRTLDRLQKEGEMSTWNVTMERRDGSSITILESLFLHKDTEYDEPILVSSFVEVTEQARLWEELKRMAYHDPLTGLPNRRFLTEQARKIFALARRRGRYAGVAYLDLDGFKAVNDQWGHQTGDEVLVAIAERAQRSIRDSDVLARIGGDEFAVVWADLDEPNQAVDATLRVLELFEEPFQIGGKVFALDFSAGVAVFPGQGEDIEELLGRADEAMYEAKERGEGLATASVGEAT